MHDELMERLYSMIRNKRSVQELESYIATQTKGPYLDHDVRGKAGGIISACYWLDSGVYFKSTTGYERMDDGMFLFDNSLKCEEIRVHGLRERILHGDTEWRFTNDPQTPATDTRINIFFASRFVRNLQGFQATPFTAHDVSRYLDNLGSPSVYSILPDRIAENPDVGYRAYRAMSIIIGSQYMEECEQGLQRVVQYDGRREAVSGLPFGQSLLHRHEPALHRRAVDGFCPAPCPGNGVSPYAGQLPVPV